MCFVNKQLRNLSFSKQLILTRKCLVLREIIRVICVIMKYFKSHFCLKYLELFTLLPPYFNYKSSTEKGQPCLTCSFRGQTIFSKENERYNYRFTKSSDTQISSNHKTIACIQSFKQPKTQVHEILNFFCVYMGIWAYNPLNKIIVNYSLNTQ